MVGGESIKKIILILGIVLLLSVSANAIKTEDSTILLECTPDTSYSISGHNEQICEVKNKNPFSVVWDIGYLFDDAVKDLSIQKITTSTVVKNKTLVLDDVTGASSSLSPTCDEGLGELKLSITQNASKSFVYCYDDYTIDKDSNYVFTYDVSTSVKYFEDLSPMFDHDYVSKLSRPENYNIEDLVLESGESLKLKIEYHTEGTGEWDLWVGELADKSFPITTKLLDPFFNNTEYYINLTGYRVGLDSNLNGSAISYYKGEVSGSYDDYYGKNNGTITGATFTTSGRMQSAYSFDGASDDIDLGGDMGMGGDATIVAWMKTSASNSHSGVVLAIESGNAAGIVMGDGGGTYGDIYMRTRVDECFKGCTSGCSDAEDGNWHMVAMTVETNNCTLYWDGDAVTSDTTAPSPEMSWGENYLIGQDDRFPTTRTFDGVIDEVAFFNETKTADEIAALYDFTASRIITNADNERENLTINNSKTGVNITGINTIVTEVNETSLGNDLQVGTCYDLGGATELDWSIAAGVNHTIGGINRAVNFSFTNCESPPTVILTSPADSLSTPLQTIEFCANVSDANGDNLNVTFFVDGSSVNVSTDVTPPTEICHNRTLSVGVHTWNVQADDGLNATNGTQRTITILNTQPVFTITSPANGSLVVNSTLPINFTVSDANNHTMNVSVVLNGTVITSNLSVATGTVFNLTANLSVLGLYNLTFSAYDSFANATVNYSFSYDPFAIRFGTSAVRDLWTSPVTNTSFVIAYLGVDKSVRYVYYNTTGALIAGPVTVDSVNHLGTAVSNNAVTTTTLNTSHIIVGYFDNTTSSNTSISFKRCILASSTCEAEVNISTNVDESYAVSCSAFNNTHIACGWNDDKTNKTRVATLKADGTLVGGPHNISTNGASENYGIEVWAYNSTQFVAGLVQDGDDDLIISFRDKDASIIITPANVDSSIGDTFGTSVACYNSTHCVIGWLDQGAGVNDASFAQYKTNGSQTIGETDADTDAGASAEAIVGVLNTTTHMLLWTDLTTDIGLQLQQYHANATAKGSVISVTSMSLPYSFHMTSQNNIAELCDDNYIVAWSHLPFGTGLFKKYKNNNSLWTTGLCNTAPSMTASSISPTPTATTDDALIGSCTASDGEGDPLTFTFTWYKNGLVHSAGSSSGVSGVSKNVGNISSALTADADEWVLNCQVSDLQYTNTTTLNSSTTTIGLVTGGGGGAGGGSSFFDFLASQTPMSVAGGVDDVQFNRCFVFTETPKCSITITHDARVDSAISDDFLIEDVQRFGENVVVLNEVMVTLEGEPNKFFQEREGLVVLNNDAVPVHLQIFNFRSLSAGLVVVGILLAVLLGRRGGNQVR